MTTCIDENFFNKDFLYAPFFILGDVIVETIKVLLGMMFFH